jgi:eukaryotic-like serine/threonine-protein kinase
MAPLIPDLPIGITMISVISVLATFGSLTWIGVKIINAIASRGKKENTQEMIELKKENSALKDRIENLETLVCRLDQEINTQLEKSLWLSRSNPGAANSQQMTAMVNITSALESRFQVLKELGRGGMGIVFLAYDKQLKDNVAIKVLSPFLSNDAESLERMRREVTAARKITHSNVIKIYDIAEAGGLHYITMEYFPGENLRQLIQRKGPLSLEEGMQLLYQICDGLEAAHGQGIIHRDLKSQNVILNDKGHLKIIDLGLARTNQLEGMTATGLIMGTPEYMSPEQVMGRRTDERSDLYSLGIILYEMFSGRVPFSGDSAISVGFKHVKEAYEPLRSVRPQIPESLSLISDRLLQKDPAHRYQSVTELRRDLEKGRTYTPQALEEVTPAEKKSVEIRN